jgi:hypothetical protein
MFLRIFIASKLIHEFQAETTAKELSSHIQLLWDQYLTTALNECTFNGNNVDIAGLLFFPPMWDSRWFSLISGISQVPDIFHFEYGHFISEFFEDKNRSGKYHVDGTVYAHATLEYFRNMLNPNHE